MDLDRAREMMAEKQLDALIASSGENIYYTSGFRTIPSTTNRGIFNQARISEAVFTITRRDGKQVLLVSAGIALVAEEQSRIKDIRFSGTGIFYERKVDLPIVANAPADALIATIKDLELAGSRIGVESNAMSANLYDKLKGTLPGATLVNGSGVFADLRKVKSPAEIAKIRRSVRIAEAGLISACEQIRPGARERDILAAYKGTLLAAGCDWGTTSCGAGGKNAGESYNPAGDYILADGDVVRFDLGAITDGYFSDLARTIAVGHVRPEVGRMYAVLLDAMKKMVAAMRPGVKLGDLYEIGAGTVIEAGYTKYVRGNLGHSFGLLVHEPPIIGAGVEEKLVPGMVMAVEAPYYVSGDFGINVEHNVLVTDDGVEILDTMHPVSLLVRDSW